MTSSRTPTLPPVLDDSQPAELVDASPREPARPRPRRVRRRTDVDGRRLTSSGHAFLVLVLALALALVLNAPGAHKRAYNQPPGWKRDVALAFTGPLASVSRVLYLDRPRVAVQALIGRSGVDEIDTDLGIDGGTSASPAAPTMRPGSTTATTPARPAAPKPARKESFTPSRPLRLWIAGDSLVITPGYALQRAAGENRAIRPVGSIDGRVATGLARPDVFNWFREIREQLMSLRPKVVVLAFGGNDDKAYMTGLPEGVSIDRFGDASWTREYRRRVGGLFDMINRAGAHAVWIGLPQTRNRAQTRRFDVVNAAVAAEARERPRSVTYVDTYLGFAGPDGQYAQYLTLPGRGEVKVRADDGVHFERAGGDVIAEQVLKALRAAYDITSWRDGSSS